MYYIVNCRLCNWRTADEASEAVQVMQAFHDHIREAHPNEKRVEFYESWITDEVVDRDILMHPGLGSD